MKIKKTTLYAAMAMILIVTAGFFMLKESSSTTNIAAAETQGGEFQKVVIGVKNLNYYPNTITVKSGIPVRIYLDSSVTGCLRSFTIKISISWLM